MRCAEALHFGWVKTLSIDWRLCSRLCSFCDLLLRYIIICWILSWNLVLDFVISLDCLTWRFIMPMLLLILWIYHHYTTSDIWKPLLLIIVFWVLEFHVLKLTYFLSSFLASRVFKIAQHTCLLLAVFVTNSKPSLVSNIFNCLFDPLSKTIFYFHGLRDAPLQWKLSLQFGSFPKL